MSEPKTTQEPTTKKEDENQSFLHEAQKFGKASDKVELDDLDEAINNVCQIINDDAVKHFNQLKEEEWETTPMKIYCLDCRAIVPAGMGKTPRGKPRTVCGSCGSKKISSGREEALIQFYHLEKH